MHNIVQKKEERKKERKNNIRVTSIPSKFRKTRCHRFTNYLLRVDLLWTTFGSGRFFEPEWLGFCECLQPARCDGERGKNAFGGLWFFNYIYIASPVLRCLRLPLGGTRKAKAPQNIPKFPYTSRKTTNCRYICKPSVGSGVWQRSSMVERSVRSACDRGS
jgi:hypothetical protein